MPNDVVVKPVPAANDHDLQIERIEAAKEIIVALRLLTEVQNAMLGAKPLTGLGVKIDIALKKIRKARKLVVNQI